MEDCHIKVSLEEKKEKKKLIYYWDRFANIIKNALIAYTYFAIAEIHTRDVKYFEEI